MPSSPRCPFSGALGLCVHHTARRMRRALRPCVTKRSVDSGHNGVRSTQQRFALIPHRRCGLFTSMQVASSRRCVDSHRDAAPDPHCVKQGFIHTHTRILCPSGEAPLERLQALLSVQYCQWRIHGAWTASSACHKSSRPSPAQPSPAQPSPADCSTHNHQPSTCVGPRSPLTQGCSAIGCFRSRCSTH